MSRYQNFAGRIRLETSNPTVPVEGDEYFNTATGAKARYDGAVWRAAAYTTTSTSTSTTTSTSTSTTTS